MDYSSLVKESLEFAFPHPVARDEIIPTLPEPDLFNLVHIVTGVRRCGKTFYLFQKIHQLLDKGVPREFIFYFNFADARLAPVSETVLMDVIDEHYRQVPQARIDGAYLFLDEVQECPDWQSACQRIAEHERATLVVTGSSSKLTSDEIATQFRGRSYSHEMMPLSFREFCTFQDVEVPDISEASEASVSGASEASASEVSEASAICNVTDVAFSPQSVTHYEALYDRYLTEGGFPGVQNLRMSEQIELLQGYVRDVVARDVAERFGREDISLANQYALYVLRNTACELSINNMVEHLQKAGFKVYWNKVRHLDEIFQQAFLYYPLSEYTTALKVTSNVTPKVYAVDQGMVYATARANQQDVGKRFETAVFLEIKRRMAGRRTDSVTSYNVPSSQGSKVDFLIGDASFVQPYALVQVCASMAQEKARHRELRSLDQAMDQTGLHEGFVIALREEETIPVTNGIVNVVPAWKWALGSAGAF